MSLFIRSHTAQGQTSFQMLTYFAIMLTNLSIISSRQEVNEKAHCNLILARLHVAMPGAKSVITATAYVVYQSVSMSVMLNLKQDDVNSWFRLNSKINVNMHY